MDTLYRPVDKRTAALDRANRVIDTLKASHDPVPMDTLVRQAGPYYLEVHQVVSTLEALHKVRKFEETIGRGPHRVAYVWKGRR